MMAALGVEGIDVSPAILRHDIRAGRFRHGTAGQAFGYVQVNLAILPLDWAQDFARYCLNNPIPCPVIGVSEPGSPEIPALGRDLDIRTDVPLYHHYRNGALVGELEDIKALWRDNFVTFAIGCSYTFERALIADGISLRHVEENRVVPMFRSGIKTVESGSFSGPMVVSMRPMPRRMLDRVVAITNAFPYAHGAPIHVGAPQEIGIADPAKPDFGQSVSIGEDEVLAFWGCGVTPQVAVENARPPICISHKPGHMLVTDLRDGEEATQAWAAAREQLKQIGSL